jgi:hypothetical protein
MTALRICSDSGNYVSIDRIDPSEEDIRIAVEVRSRGFTGRIDTWIMRQACIDFCERLSVLEHRRHGEATVESISPKELRLSVRSVDRAGHMAIEGSIGYRGTKGETLLSFSAMSFDPSALPALLRDARAIAGPAP